MYQGARASRAQPARTVSIVSGEASTPHISACEST